MLDYDKMTVYVVQEVYIDDCENECDVSTDVICLTEARAREYINDININARYIGYEEGCREGEELEDYNAERMFYHPASGELIYYVITPMEVI